LPYRFQVNLDSGSIMMQNFAKKGVPLLLYDRTRFSENDFRFSYALYAKQEVSHEVNLSQYNYEVFGPNGFL
jgi:phospholipase C